MEVHDIRSDLNEIKVELRIIREFISESELSEDEEILLNESFENEKSNGLVSSSALRKDLGI